MPKLLSIRQHPQLAANAAKWFSSKWNIPEVAYIESMTDCVSTNGAVPQWYIALDGDRIIGGLGVIENDFHNRSDLAPNICAVYVEPEHRNKGLAGELLDMACRDMRAYGLCTLFLVTDHDSF